MVAGSQQAGRFLMSRLLDIRCRLSQGEEDPAFPPSNSTARMSCSIPASPAILAVCRGRRRDLTGTVKEQAREAARGILSERGGGSRSDTFFRGSLSFGPPFDNGQGRKHAPFPKPPHFDGGRTPFARSPPSWKPRRCLNICCCGVQSRCGDSVANASTADATLATGAWAGTGSDPSANAQSRGGNAVGLDAHQRTGGQHRRPAVGSSAPPGGAAVFDLAMGDAVCPAFPSHPVDLARDSRYYETVTLISCNIIYFSTPVYSKTRSTYVRNMKRKKKARETERGYP